jgi:hypothetical protein
LAGPPRRDEAAVGEAQAQFGVGERPAAEVLLAEGVDRGEQLELADRRRRVDDAAGVDEGVDEDLGGLDVVGLDLGLGLARGGPAARHAGEQLGAGGRPGRSLVGLVVADAGSEGGGHVGVLDVEEGPAGGGRARGSVGVNRRRSASGIGPASGSRYCSAFAARTQAWVGAVGQVAHRSLARVT